MPILRFGWLWSKQSFDTDTSFWQLLLPVAKLSNFHLTVYQTRWQAFIAKGSSTWLAWSQNADWPAAHHSKCKECKSCLECRLTLCCCVTCWIKIQELLLQATRCIVVALHATCTQKGHCNIGSIQNNDFKHLATCTTLAVFVTMAAYIIYIYTYYSNTYSHRVYIYNICIGRVYITHGAMGP